MRVSVHRGDGFGAIKDFLLIMARLVKSIPMPSLAKGAIDFGTSLFNEIIGIADKVPQMMAAMGGDVISFSNFTNTMTDATLAQWQPLNAELSETNVECRVDGGPDACQWARDGVCASPRDTSTRDNTPWCPASACPCSCCVYLGRR